MTAEQENVIVEIINRIIDRKMKERDLIEATNPQDTDRRVSGL